MPTEENKIQCDHCSNSLAVEDVTDLNHIGDTLNDNGWSYYYQFRKIVYVCDLCHYTNDNGKTVLI